MISMGDAEQRKNDGKNHMGLTWLFWVLVLHLWGGCVEVWVLKIRITHLISFRKCCNKLCREREASGGL